MLGRSIFGFFGLHKKVSKIIHCLIGQYVSLHKCQNLYCLHEDIHVYDSFRVRLPLFFFVFNRGVPSNHNCLLFFFLDKADNNSYKKHDLKSFIYIFASYTRNRWIFFNFKNISHHYDSYLQFLFILSRKREQIKRTAFNNPPRVNDNKDPTYLQPPLSPYI